MAGTENNGTETTATEEAEPQSQVEDTEQAQPETVTKADLDALRAESQAREKAAYDAARRAENKAEIARREAAEKIGRLEAQLDTLATRDLPPDQAQAYALQREVERLKANPAKNDASAVQAQFANWSAQTLADEGFDLSALPKEVNDAFQKRAAGSASITDWQAALYGAIADYRKVEAAQARKEAGDREKKAREDERTKIQNGSRASQPRVDRGGPSATGGKPVSEMSSEEFAAHLASQGYAVRGKLA